MALLMQDFGSFHGLNIWVELEDDSLRSNDQTRLFLFVKNSNPGLNARQVEVGLSTKPKGPALYPDKITIENIVTGRTVREPLTINVGDSKKTGYELNIVVNFHLVPGVWKVGVLPFHVQ